jgi:hypothetical protein
MIGRQTAVIRGAVVGFFYALGGLTAPPSEKEKEYIVLTTEFSRLCVCNSLYNNSLWSYSREFTTLKGINISEVND